jgi:hypothetical protein
MARITTGRRARAPCSAVRRDERLDEAQPVEPRREPVAAPAAKLLPRRRNLRRGSNRSGRSIKR